MLKKNFERGRAKESLIKNALTILDNDSMKSNISAINSN